MECVLIPALHVLFHCHARACLGLVDGALAVFFTSAAFHLRLGPFSHRTQMSWAGRIQLDVGDVSREWWSHRSDGR